MTLAQLQYAISLRKHGSFKKAAEHLAITQPALSLQIQKLEDEIGMVLFDRSRSPIAPTADGSSFLLRAEEIVFNVQKLEHFVQELSQDFHGKLTIGIIPTLAPFLTPLFIEELQNDYPKLEIDIVEMLTDQVIEGVRNGDLDAGLLSTPCRVFGIQTTPLFYERFFFYTSGKEGMANDIRLENIDYQKLWLLNEGNCFRDQINNFCDLNAIRKNKRFVYRSNSIDSLIRIVDAKGGMTILPELTTLSLDEQQEQQISPIGNKAREIGLITRNHCGKERFIEKLTSYIRKNIPSKMLIPNGLTIVDPEIA
ncbi:hydrogen peroxide-inducible genes activator [Cytophagales bacterium LB-30]|uniref:Hydrogen peroxide-inducible genes activator n=1 Tax=Shiella aurantiaca TaxID=3058365 RepID=A0ABT8F0R6_9BACT|nr:hydrogen peroxide-inducible genes activator [Shiella aurantiaca]MDN4163988.1 hydrogen peroxide-inducible genes activator [Shiella aurantiaca]